MPADPYLTPLPPRGPVDEESKPQSLDEVLQSLLLQRVNEPAPSMPPVSNAQAGWGAYLAARHPQQVPMIAGLVGARPAGADQFKAWAERQSQIGPLASSIASLHRQTGVQERFDQREARQRYRPHARVKFNPQTNTNETVYDIEDTLAPPGSRFAATEVTGQEAMRYMGVEGAGGEMHLMPTRPTGSGAAAPGSRSTGGIPQGTGGGPQNYSNNRGGTGVFKAPPAGVSENLARQSQFIAGLRPIFDMHAEANRAVKASGMAKVGGMLGETAGKIGQAVTDKLSQGVYSREFVDSTVRQFNQSLRIAAYQYVKAQTGAQFSVKEMDRYLSLFPTSLTDPVEAQHMIANLIQQAIDYIEAQKVRWNVIQTPNGPQYVQPGYTDTDPDMNPLMPPAARKTPQQIFDELESQSRHSQANP